MDQQPTPVSQGEETPQEETQRVLQRLRLRIYLSDLTQRQIEQRIGLSRGYLSQILLGNVSLKVWHLLAILEAMGLAASEFFAELYPIQDESYEQLLEPLRKGSSTRDESTRAELVHLYGFGIEALLDLRERLERCEQALEQAGVLDQA